MVQLDEEARQFAELLPHLDQESFELATAAVNRLKRNHDGCFTARPKALYRCAFRSAAERNRALWNLIVDRSQLDWRADTQELS